MPRVVGEAAGYLFIWKPQGWLCPGADVDLLKGESLPKTATEMGVTTFASLVSLSKQKDPPQLQWFCRLCTQKVMSTWIKLQFWLLQWLGRRYSWIDSSRAFRSDAARIQGSSKEWGCDKDLSGGYVVKAKAWSSVKFE